MCERLKQAVLKKATGTSPALQFNTLQSPTWPEITPKCPYSALIVRCSVRWHSPGYEDVWLTKFDDSSGSIRIYIKNSEPKRRVEIHYHKSSETFRNPRLLRGVLASTGWTVEDLKRLKLVK